MKEISSGLKGNDNRTIAYLPLLLYREGYGYFFQASDSAQRTPDFRPWLQQFLYLRRFQARKRYGAVVQCSPGILQAGQEGAAIYERNQFRAEG